MLNKLPLIVLSVLGISCFALSLPDFALTAPISTGFKVNPAATSNYNGAAGSNGEASVNQKGELFVNKIASPVPLGVAPTIASGYPVQIVGTPPPTPNGGFQAEGVVITTPVATATPGNAAAFALNKFQAAQCAIDSGFQGAAATGLLKLLSSTSYTSADAAPGIAVRNDTDATNFAGSNGLYSPIAVDQQGSVSTQLIAKNRTSSAVRAEDQAVADGHGTVLIGAVYQSTPAQSAGTVGDASDFITDALGRLWTNSTLPNTFTMTQPSVTNTTSFTCLASNANRHGFTLQNNSGANIMINLNNGTLTGITPTSTNLGIVLTAGSSYTSPANAVPTAAVTCYQSSGGTINTISVMEY